MIINNNSNHQTRKAFAAHSLKTKNVNRISPPSLSHSVSSVILFKINITLLSKTVVTAIPAVFLGGVLPETTWKTPLISIEGSKVCFLSVIPAKAGIQILLIPDNAKWFIFNVNIGNQFFINKKLSTIN